MTFWEIYCDFQVHPCGIKKANSCLSGTAIRAVGSWTSCLQLLVTLEDDWNPNMRRGCFARGDVKSSQGVNSNSKRSGNRAVMRKKRLWTPVFTEHFMLCTPKRGCPRDFIISPGPLLNWQSFYKGQQLLVLDTDRLTSGTGGDGGRFLCCFTAIHDSVHVTNVPR